MKRYLPLAVILTLSIVIGAQAPPAELPISTKITLAVWTDGPPRFAGVRQCTRICQYPKRAVDRRCRMICGQVYDI
jgi:hypothetical protein